MSTFPSAVSGFLNYLVNTRESRVFSSTKIFNALAKQAYLMSEMVRGSSGEMAKAKSSGREFRETIKLVPFSNSRTFLPGDERTPTRGTEDVAIIAPWRFHETNRPINDYEIDTNEGDMFVQFKDLKTSIMQGLYTDHINFMEAQLWNTPDGPNMENRNASPTNKMYSIPSIIVESSRQAPVSGWGAVATSTIHTASPNTLVNWRNQVSRFDSAQLDDPQNGLFSAFDEIFAKLQFVPPPGFEKYMENDDLRGMKIVCNLDGYNAFQSLLRDANNSTRAGAQDPSYGMPTFKGIPVKWIPAIDEALLDETGSVSSPLGSVAEGTYTNQVYPAGKPRFFFINCNYFKAIFHPNHMMRETDPITGGARQRDVNTVFLESVMNLMCFDRRRQGIVCPL